MLIESGYQQEEPPARPNQLIPKNYAATNVNNIEIDIEEVDKVDDDVDDGKADDSKPSHLLLLESATAAAKGRIKRM